MRILLCGLVAGVIATASTAAFAQDTTNNPPDPGAATVSGSVSTDGPTVAAYSPTFSPAEKLAAARSIPLAVTGGFGFGSDPYAGALGFRGGVNPVNNAYIGFLFNQHFGTNSHSSTDIGGEFGGVVALGEHVALRGTVGGGVKLIKGYKCSSLYTADGVPGDPAIVDDDGNVGPLTDNGDGTYTDSDGNQRSRPFQTCKKATSTVPFISPSAQLFFPFSNGFFFGLEARADFALGKYGDRKTDTDTPASDNYNKNFLATKSPATGFTTSVVIGFDICVPGIDCKPKTPPPADQSVNKSDLDPTKEDKPKKIEFIDEDAKAKAADEKKRQDEAAAAEKKKQDDAAADDDDDDDAKKKKKKKDDKKKKKKKKKKPKDDDDDDDE